MSATIGNINELATFLHADVYNKDFRPVELREHIKCGADILEIKKNAICADGTFVPTRTVEYNVCEKSFANAIYINFFPSLTVQ